MVVAEEPSAGKLVGLAVIVVALLMIPPAAKALWGKLKKANVRPSSTRTVFFIFYFPFR